MVYAGLPAISPQMETLLLFSLASHKPLALDEVYQLLPLKLNFHLKLQKYQF